MARYANQKQITTKKVRTDAGKPFMIVDIETMIKAAKNLNGNEFKLYMYLSKNADDYVYNLSQIDVEMNIGLAKSTYYRAIDALIEKGYLYQPNPQVNNWIFTQIPKMGNKESQNEPSQNETNISQIETEKSHFEYRNSINSINSIDSIDDACNALYDKEGNYLGIYGF